METMVSFIGLAFVRKNDFEHQMSLQNPYSTGIRTQKFRSRHNVAMVWVCESVLKYVDNETRTRLNIFLNSLNVMKSIRNFKTIIENIK